MIKKNEILENLKSMKEDFCVYISRIYFRFFAQESGVRFVVLSKGRCGSTYLMRMLSSHPKIRVSEEILGTYILNKRVKERIKKLGCVFYLESFLQPLIGKTCAGVKILYFSLEKKWQEKNESLKLFKIEEYLRRHKDIKIVHLKRKNKLDVLRSTEVAQITKQWHYNKSEAIKNCGKINLSIEECWSFFKEIESQEVYYESLFREHDTFEVYYEDLIRNPQKTWSDLLKFICVNPHRLITKLKKINTLPLSESIENYEELKEFFSKTEYKIFFE